MSITQLRKWVKRWEKAAPELKRIRIHEMCSADISATAEALEDSLRSALKNNPPRPTSGLVEQQRWFKKMKQCNP